MASRFGIGEFIERLEPRHRVGLGLILLIGGCVADFASGPAFSGLLLYLGAVSFAAWYIGPRFAVFVSFATAGSGFLVDSWGGPSPPARAYWNFVMRLLSFLVVARLTREKRTEFERIRNHGARDALALHAERSFSGSLLNELDVREAEQRRIGRDLHDGLSQTLTAAVLASQVLEEKLVARALGEAALARNIGGLTRDAMGRVQEVARGLYPADLMAAGLPGALERLAATTRDLARVECVFTTNDEETSLDEAISTHLFRIAQEAVGNAVRHARAGRICIDVTQTGDRVDLTVSDNGVGIPDDAAGSAGLGLRTMRERARGIGGSLEVERLPRGGTRVRCAVGGDRRPSDSVNGVAVSRGPASDPAGDPREIAMR